MEDKLEKLYDKKIVVYGTGKIAEEVIASFPKEKIIGVLDRTKLIGSVSGIPIIVWEDIEEDSVDILLIAASVKNYSPIYWRILDKCVALGMKIYGANGQNLMKYFGVGSSKQNICFNVDKEELKQKIQNYDVISFDVFDTLIMRNTLEPTDIFDIVEANLKKKNINIPNFKRYRREAELQSKGGDICKIYDILKVNLSLDEVTKQLILEEELACEKKYIIPRTEMLDAYKYAVQLGKDIYIVSDMYLPSDMIKDLLNQFGITKIDALFVSCEYGLGKGNGLFNIVKSHFGNKACLHIGDNHDADIKPAQMVGIDAYEINSAFDLFHGSSLHYVSGFAKTINDKILLGLIAAELFNNPFTPVSELDCITFSSLKSVCNVLIAPFVINWVYKLKYILEDNDYDGILFAARDGYFLKKIYDMLPETLIKKIPSYYTYCSRKLAIRTGMDSYDEIASAISIYNLEKSNKNQIENMFGIQISSESEDYMLTEKENIQNHSKMIRQYYKKYLINSGIDFSKKYLLFDLDGRGTSHYFLNKLFSKGLNSFYLFKYHTQGKYEMDSDAVYDFYFPNPEYSSLVVKFFCLEMFFSAPHASVNEIDKNGKPVYEEEVRSEKMISLMKSMQDYVYSYIKKYFDECYIDGLEVSKGVAEHIYDIFAMADYVNEAKVISEMKLYDEITGNYLEIL